MGQMGELTQLLRQLSENHGEPDPRLVTFIYSELKHIAAGLLRGERPHHTLQPTALVNEAFMKLLKQDQISWQNRTHFFATAARVMRQVLVDYARARNALRRGAGEVRVPLSDHLALTESDYTTILAVDQALDQLKELDARQARVVELRFFAGLTEEEIAGLLDVSERTVKRDWIAARAWLHAELSTSESVDIPKPGDPGNVSG
ncbi:MAG: sigma-70 family RNA polymerase sigma factor [Paludibaculum sp.]